eukprot:CAMPEP_0117657426 /NCGR_PEP_ID=MMETSP0804-20121206/5324_1 /TAXON_ID=1074897 /ORGANISM="Tetraselmis astigmatica, Strain CCMP880" /LENGTH=40 /DNA_ID= /DNA_START= /DNA_END= /DNA_ORIENTATION=
MTPEYPMWWWQRMRPDYVDQRQLYDLQDPCEEKNVLRQEL